MDEVWRRFLRVEDEEGLASIAGGLWIGSTKVVVLSMSQHRLTESAVGLSLVCVVWKACARQPGGWVAVWAGELEPHLVGQKL